MSARSGCSQIKSQIGNVSEQSLYGHKEEEAQLLTRNYCRDQWLTGPLFIPSSNLLRNTEVQLETRLEMETDHAITDHHTNKSFVKTETKHLKSTFSIRVHESILSRFCPLKISH